MKIDVELVKELRRLTSAGVMDCKTALEESEGDVQKAIDILRKKGISKAAKKSDRATNQGIISSYVHFNGQLGSLVEILCETDFVSSNKEFKDFAELIAMHIAAAQPGYVSKEDVPQDIIDREKEIYKEQMKDDKKPENIKEKIIENKLN
ncbi:MAG TPA: translation elongation factor Ts, partial [Firmicutes bacterium]|nr:translation elongation factor Ts [Bacillota bacterium]